MRDVYFMWWIGQVARHDVAILDLGNKDLIKM